MRVRETEGGGKHQWTPRDTWMAVAEVGEKAKTSKIKEDMYYLHLTPYPLSYFFMLPLVL